MAHGGAAVARILQREGVTTLFTLCGGHIMSIYDGCLDLGIRVVDVRHEQAAAFAADAWSRLTGRTGVAAVTAGPGITNAFTAIANAARAQSPVVILGGAAPVALLGKGALQELDILEALRPVTKWATRVVAADRITEILARAFRIAGSGVPGPVYVELPVDVLFAPVEVSETALPPPAPPRPRLPAPAEAVAEALALLAGAERPVALIGSQIRWSPEWTTAADWAERFGVPVYASGMARGLMPAGHSWGFLRSRKQALSQADLVFILGTPLDFRLNYGTSINPGARLVQVDLDPAQLGHNRAAAVAMHADPGTVLRQMLDLGRQMPGSGPRTAWQQSLAAAEAAAVERAQPLLTATTRPVQVLRLCAELDAVLGPEATIIGDGGDYVATAASWLRVRRYPAGWLDPGPLGTLGMGMGFALAAAVARPGTQVAVLLGDGAAGLDLMEYEAAVRQNIPFVAIVGNDGAWTQIRRGQIDMYGSERAVATELSYAAYDRVVSELGGHGEYVEDPEQLRPSLERAFASGKPALVNVRLAPSNLRAGAISI